MDPVSRKIRLATGLDYHVLEWGKDKHDHTVVLIHGFLELGWTFAALARALATHFHVVAPDMRGHGDSDRVGAGGYYYFFDYLADLDSLLPEVARDQVSLVGSSMGGMISSYYAGMRPDAVEKLALLEGILTPESSGPIPDRVSHWVAAAKSARKKTNRVYPSLEAAADRLQKFDRRVSRQIALELVSRGTTPVPGGFSFKHDPLHVTRGPYPFQVGVAQEFWQRITCPVLLIDAAESEIPLEPAEYARRKACIPHARTATLPNAGHLMHRHQPEQLGKLLREFLAG